MDMYNVQTVMVPKWSKGEGETPLVRSCFHRIPQKLWLSMTDNHAISFVAGGALVIGRAQV